MKNINYTALYYLIGGIFLVCFLVNVRYNYMKNKKDKK